MDYNSLKRASNLLENKFISKKDLNTLLDDTSEYYILRSIPEPRKRKICQDIIKHTLLSKIRDGKLLVSSELIIDEIKRHFAAESVELKGYEVSDSRITLTLASSKWFIGFIKPRMWFRIDKVELNSETQTIVVEYGFDSSILDFAVKEAVNYYSRPYIKILEKTDRGGKIAVDLSGYIKDFDKKVYIKNLDCTVFDLVFFSSTNHSMNGVNLICDQNWLEIVNNIHMRLDIIEAQNSKKMPSVWLMHRE